MEMMDPRKADGSELNNEMLGQRALDLQQSISRLQEDLLRVQQQLEKEEQELRLIVELLRLRGYEGSLAMVSEAESSRPNLSALQPLRTDSAVDSAGLTAEVITILREANKPLHIKDLVEAVRARHLRIPGRGEPANLIAHIRRCADIVRPSRGVYGLREWGLEDKEPVASRTSRKRSTTSRARRSTKRQTRAGERGR
jgi:hypothetical protein